MAHVSRADFKLRHYLVFQQVVGKPQEEEERSAEEEVSPASCGKTPELLNNELALANNAQRERLRWMTRLKKRPILASDLTTFAR